MNSSINKRINVLIAVLIIMTAVFFWRLAQKQLFEHQSYLAQADEQYIVKKDVPAVRGKIYSSDMFPLATNTRLYQVLVVPNNVPDDKKKETAKKLAPLVQKT